MISRGELRQRESEVYYADVHGKGVVAKWKNDRLYADLFRDYTLLMEERRRVLSGRLSRFRFVKKALLNRRLKKLTGWLEEVNETGYAMKVEDISYGRRQEN